MGYSTDWHGGLELSRSLTPSEQKEWDYIVETRHDSDYGYGDPKREYPSIWCNFEVDRNLFRWNETEKTYEGYGWIKYFLKTCQEWSMENGLVYATGEMIWEGEESDDRGRVMVGYDTKTNLYTVEEEIAELHYTYSSNDKQTFKRGGKLKVIGRTWEQGGMVKQAEKMRSFKNEMDNSIRKSKTEIEDSKRSIQKNRENLIDSAENIKREEKSIIDNMRGMTEDAKEAQEFERRAKKYDDGGYINPIRAYSNEVEEQLDCETEEVCDDVIERQDVQDVIVGSYNRGDKSSSVANRLKSRYFAHGGEVSLYFQQGSSDKEYHIQVEEEGGGYVVNFQYGRIGHRLKSGTKTPNPVSLGEAERIYYKLLQSKEVKGYVQDKVYAKGGEIYEYDYQDEVHKMVSDLTEEEYENFCSNYDIDPEDASQMQWFIGDLDEDDADEVMSEIRINIKYKERKFAKGGRPPYDTSLMEYPHELQKQINRWVNHAYHWKTGKDGRPKFFEAFEPQKKEHLYMRWKENPHDFNKFWNYLDHSNRTDLATFLSHKDSGYWQRHEYAKGGRTYSRENRPSPSDSATIFEVGYRSRGNDGNIWEIRENIKGTHRWVKLKG